MSHITLIGIHHFGSIGNNPLAKSSFLTEKDINNAHHNRWPDFPSELNGSYIGYNCVIFPNGELKQYRLLGEETSAQKGHNFDTFSICLSGNFTKGVESPTIEQVMRLKSLLWGLITDKPESIGIKVKEGTTYHFSRNNIYPHRILQPNHTACYGDSLSDTWASDLIAPIVQPDKDLLITILELCQKVIKLLKKKPLGVQLHDCNISDVRG